MFKCKAVARKHDVGRVSDEGPGWAANQGSLAREWSLNFHLENWLQLCCDITLALGFRQLRIPWRKLSSLNWLSNELGRRLPALELGRRIPQLVALRGPLVLVSLPCLP